jgi:hypothetical protein
LLAIRAMHCRWHRDPFGLDGGGVVVVVVTVVDVVVVVPLPDVVVVVEVVEVVVVESAAASINADETGTAQPQDASRRQALRALFAAETARRPHRARARCRKRVQAPFTLL